MTDLPTKVLLVDDHPVVREGLRGMIDAEPDSRLSGRQVRVLRRSRWPNPYART
jgi:DNA-binding NarL/FixJ family response regulator